MTKQDLGDLIKDQHSRAIQCGLQTATARLTHSSSLLTSWRLWSHHWAGSFCCDSEISSKMPSPSSSRPDRVACVRLTFPPVKLQTLHKSKRTKKPLKALGSNKEGRNLRGSSLENEGEHEVSAQFPPKSTFQLRARGGRAWAESSSLPGWRSPVASSGTGRGDRDCMQRAPDVVTDAPKVLADNWAARAQGKTPGHPAERSCWRS